ncbi:MAG: hypothetical protein OER88_00230 [Planctomycetota bacterium]|nr:hypothetical protein [Planctomycetota bacterium]
MRRFDSVCVLGGAGLVGYQVARRLLRPEITDRLVIVSLGRGEVSRAVAALRKEFPAAEVLGRYGNVFARGRLADSDTDDVEPVSDRRDPERRRALLSDIYESFDDAMKHSALVRLVRDTEPAAVVDCINTATAISYQDVPTAAKQLMAHLGLRETADVAREHFREDLEGLLVSIEIPQLILHVRMLHAALTEAGSHVYLKVGTTGTGGMGLNIPYTHGEDKPSPILMAKTAVAFAHTGLLFLAARTPGGPVFKELKPAAMIGYREVAVHEVPGYVWKQHGDRFVKERSRSRPLFEAQRADLGAPLDLTPDPSRFAVRQDAAGARTLRLACVNTGENGWFARGEFEAITALDQMEMITPEEIARASVQELCGRTTGSDVLGAIDASILAPTYKGGLLRQVALDRIQQIEGEGSVPSIALGDLGPPQLSKYLFELSLMQAEFGDVEATAAGLRKDDAAPRLASRLEAMPDLRDLVVSVGIPVLLPDGATILRGPEIKIPGYDPNVASRGAEPHEIDAWAAKGWVDLRPQSLVAWADRLDHVLASRRGGSAGASDAMGHETYGRDDFRVGEVVAWVFANEPGFRGFRIK